MASSSNEEVEFYKELDNINLHLPGFGNLLIPFNANQLLLEMLHKVYPNWDQKGNISSVPTARIPQMFLHNQATCEELEKTSKATEKNEFVENLRKLFAHGYFADQPGIMIFPSFDGSQIFKTQIGKVEIGMVLVHPRKVVFVFNVKNVSGKSVPAAKLRKDIHKHKRFMQMLMNYKLDRYLEQNGVPIHIIICNFPNASKKYKYLEDKTDDVIFVFNKNDLDPANFSKLWVNKTTDNEIKSNVKSTWAFDILVARLVALSSFENSPMSLIKI